MSAAETRLIGAPVQDSDDPDPDPARVVNVPGEPADEWEVVGGDHTVATYPGNEDYPDDAPVVVIVFEDDLAEHDLDEWDGDQPLTLSGLAEQGVRYWSFPAQRLELLGGGDDGY
jgi:hypothetical protein